MNKYIYIFSTMIFLLTTGAAQAMNCELTHQQKPFRQVVLYKKGNEGGVRCDYGRDEFDFKHSYELSGLFVPVSGPWLSSPEPWLIYCRSIDATACQFNAKHAA